MNPPNPPNASDPPNPPNASDPPNRGPLGVDHVTMACEDFRQFVTTWAVPEGADDELVFLEDLLAAWLDAGAGIESTAADYDHFLQVVMAIIDGVLTGVISLDRQGPDGRPYARWMIGLVPPRRNGSVLSRMGYDHVVHQTLEARRSEELTAELRRLLPESGQA
jgi:hypothetical protein